MKTHLPQWMESLPAAKASEIHLAASGLAGLNPLGAPRSLVKGQTLFREGEQPAGIFHVTQGSLRLFKAGPEGQEQILDLALPGALLGLRALAASESYSASACARETSEVVFYEGESFMNLIEDEPGMARAVLAQVGRQLREARQEILERSTSNVGARLAHWLLHVEALYKAQGRPIRVSGQELAGMVGAAYETVSRQLTRFREAGYIERRGRSIVIVNAQAMRETAGELAVPNP